MGRRKLNKEMVKKEFEKEGYTLLTTEYINNRQKLEYICDKGHHHSITYSDFQQGNRCPYCKGRTPLTIEMVREDFEKEGYTLLTTEYINNEQKLEYICDKGHHHSITYGHFQQGSRCPYCKRARLTTEMVREDFEKEGYTLLTTEYINNEQKLEYICDKGHHHSITYGSFKQGRRCLYCAIERSKVEFNKVKKEFEKEGYTLLTTEYINNEQKLEYICDKGHHHSIAYGNFQQGNRCPYCKTSKGEKKIKDILDIFEIKYIHNKNIWDDNHLRPDFYLEDYNLVIEYDGIQHFEPIEYFGGEEKFKMTQQKDIEKNDYCKANNIDMFRIPYWEYENIETILKRKLNLERPSTTRA